MEIMIEHLQPGNRGSSAIPKKVAELADINSRRLMLSLSLGSQVMALIRFVARSTASLLTSSLLLKKLSDCLLQGRE
jgi:hypothetical protein